MKLDIPEARSPITIARYYFDGLNTSHFDLKVKTEIHYFTSPETANSRIDLSKGEVDTETPGQAPRNSFD